MVRRSRLVDRGGFVGGSGGVVFGVFGLTAVLHISNESRVTISNGVGNSLGTAVREEDMVSRKKVNKFVNKQLINCKQTADLLSVGGVSVSVFVLSEVNRGVAVVILNCVFVVVSGWGVFVFGGVVGGGGGVV